MRFSRFFAKDKIKLDIKQNIVFYSEGGQYWHLFKPVIEELNNLNIECSYYTSDKFDAGLKFQATKFDSLFIGFYIPFTDDFGAFCDCDFFRSSFKYSLLSRL